MISVVLRYLFLQEQAYDLRVAMLPAESAELASFVLQALSFAGSMTLRFHSRFGVWSTKALQRAPVTVVTRMLTVASEMVPLAVSSMPNGMGRAIGKKTIL